ncbi:putative mitochondrial RNA binding complex 1 subunit, partial [Trypanosoma cruzi]
MRRILQPPTYGVSGLFAMAIKSATGLRSGTGTSLASRPMTLHVSVRAQGGFGGGRPARGQRGGGGGGNEGRDRGGGGGGGSGGGAAQSKGGAARRTVINKTGDGELSDFTRIVMRDDSHILKNIVKHIPQNGAISVKSLHAQLSPDVQEAIAEKYDGLKNFLEQRKQLFVVKTNPADGVLYAAATPLAMQKLVAREKQR